MNTTTGWPMQLATEMTHEGTRGIPYLRREVCMNRVTMLRLSARAVDSAVAATPRARQRYA